MLKKLQDYKHLLQKFIDKEYIFSDFSESVTPEKQVLLRHDIDFDVSLAHEIACVEDSLGIKATYFFMLRSHSYNILDSKNTEIIQSLQARGHKISIHFDPSIYDDFLKGFQQERNIFENLFNTNVDCISIHRPIEYFLNNNNLIDGVRHTYQPLYFKEIKYFADSQGEFRYGHPLESEEFALSRSIHLLIHPIWWVTNQTQPLTMLNELIDYRVKLFQNHIALNCKPYRKYVEDVS